MQFPFNRTEFIVNSILYSCHLGMKFRGFNQIIHMLSRRYRRRRQTKHTDTNIVVVVVHVLHVYVYRVV